MSVAYSESSKTTTVEALENDPELPGSSKSLSHQKVKASETPRSSLMA